MWIDIASIVFVCVTANHLGLIKAIGEYLDAELTIISCPKCFTYWSTLCYTVFATHDIITSLAISFLASYSALWLELLEGFTDTFYVTLYEKIYSENNNGASATDARTDHSACPMPNL